MISVQENKTWEPYVLPVRKSVIPVKGIFKTKLSAEDKFAGTGLDWCSRVSCNEKEWISLRPSQKMPNLPL